MSNFYQKNILSYADAQIKLNDNLSGLDIVRIQNASSDTKHLFITIYSEKHDANYYFSIGTDNWTWKNSKGKEIPVFKDEFIDNHYHMLAITDELNELIKNKLKIKKIELTEKSKLLQIYFEDYSVLVVEEDIESKDQSYYQLILEENKLYQNYNLVTQRNSWLEEITDGTEKGEYKVALFDLDYFRMEHRNFTSHAIKQARKKNSPVSFIQAKILYHALTTNISGESIWIFSPWGIRRSSVDRIRLDTIPVKELIEITRDECFSNDFSVEEAEDIMKSTIHGLKKWIDNERDIETIAKQEYAHQGFIYSLVSWYEENFMK